MTANSLTGRLERLTFGDDDRFWVVRGEGLALVWNRYYGLLMTHTATQIDADSLHHRDCEFLGIDCWYTMVDDTSLLVYHLREMPDDEGRWELLEEYWQVELQRIMRGQVEQSDG